MKRGASLRILIAGAASIVAHGVAGALLVETLRPAPINQQTLPETSLDLIGYEAPRGEIIEKDAGGATAQAAGANATQLSQGAIRRVTVRTAPPPTSYAALQRPASARTETTLQTMQTLDSVDPSVSAASELDADGEILDARDPDPFPLVDEIHITGQQTLTAVTTAKIPLLQTVPTETHVLSSLAVPDALEPIPSRETRAASPPPVSQQTPSGSLKFDRSAVIEPFETALDAPSPPDSQINLTEPVGEETTMLTPPASNTLTGETVTPVPTPAATLRNVALTAPAPSGLKLSAETGIGRSTPTTPPAEIAAPWRNPVTAELPATTAPHGATVDAPSPSGPFVPAGRPASLNAPVRPPPTIGAPAGVPDSRPVTAGLAWSGSGEDSFDPVSLAAIQSFVTEEDLRSSDAGTLRDGISDLLAQVPCARLQVAFDPESGTLALRGHVPEAGLRGPVAEALRAQVGGSIPVVDLLQVLPRPQCGALAGMAAVGLPQSTDQETDPRLIGESSYSMIYRYVAGDRMIFDLTAPDYDASIYVDYFDASGMVVHLVPNEKVTLERHAAKSAITIGADRADGNFMAVMVGPPYGQEIAVAFATSAPLFETARVTVEPAEPYLDWLRDRIREARAADPGFKGEWVYFFVASSQK